MAVASDRRTTTRAFMHIRSQLLRRIGRQWRPGDRLPSIRELSAQLGSGYVNTHRAIKSLTDDGLLVARDRVGIFVASKIDDRKLGEHEPVDASANAHVARPLAGLNVHLLVPEIRSDGLNELIIDGFREEILKHGCRLQVNEGGHRTKMDLTDLDCEGVALFHPSHHQIITRRPDQSMVLIGQGIGVSLNVSPSEGYDMVGVDHCHGGVQAGEYLRRIGMRNVCFIGRMLKLGGAGSAKLPKLDAISQMRLVGFEQGYRDIVPDKHRLLADWYGLAPGARMVPKYLAMKPRPEAIFAATDELALGFIHGAQAHGLEPGRDYQIMGFDGQSLGRELHEGALTTVDIPSIDMGRRGAQLLADRLLNPKQPMRHLTLGCSLFEGATAHPRKKSSS